MRRFMLVAAGGVAAGVGAVLYWRRDPRVVVRFMNEVVDPFLVGRGMSGVGRSELGTIEHVGRRSGIVRRTPIHPVAEEDGFRIVVPLGLKSEWAHNVLVGGHCRMQLHDVVYELDEPMLLLPREMADLNVPTRWLADRLGFMYLRLHRFAEHAGTLDSVGVAVEAAEAKAGAPAREFPEPVVEVPEAVAADALPTNEPTEPTEPTVPTEEPAAADASAR